MGWSTPQKTKGPDQQLRICFSPRTWGQLHRPHRKFRTPRRMNNNNLRFENSERMIRALDDRSIPTALNDPVSKNPEELPAPPGRPD